MSTIREFGFAGKRHGIPPHVIGLPEAPEYGLFYCTTPEGLHTTIAGDAEYVRACLDGAAAGVIAGMNIAVDKFPWVRFGWPDEWDNPADPTAWQQQKPVPFYGGGAGL